MSVRASRIRTVMGSASLHVAKTEESSRDGWSKVGKIHIIGGWKVDKITRMCDRARAAYTA